MPSPALAGLPAIPGTACPAAAAALGAAGLGPVCQVASGLTGVAGSAASQVAGFGIDSVLNALGTWVANGAAWLLAQIGAVIGDTTGVDLGASWFTTHYGTMAALAAVVIVPLLLLGIMQSIYRQNASMLIRSVVVNVPLAILLTAVAVKLVQLGLAVTDAMSAAVAHGAGLDAGHFMASVTLEVSGQAAGQPGVPAFVLFLGGLAVVCGAVLVWIELLIRAAAVYVAVLFLPLALASLAWPAIAHWTRRLVDTLVALILGKFVIVSVLSLGAGALAGGTGSSPSATSAGGAGSAPGGGGGFGAVLGGAALLLLSAVAPWALFRLLPFLEAGAIGHLEGVSHRSRQQVFGPAKSLARDAMRVSMAGSFAGAAAGGAAGAVAGALGRAGGGGPGAAGGHTGTPIPRPGPDMGPSSTETTGVGTTEPPGHSIPMWPVHQKATAAARRHMVGGFEGAGADGPAGRAAGPAHPSSTSGSAPDAGTGTAAAVRPLPRQTGALSSDALGRDELGIRLITFPTVPTATSLPTDSGPPTRLDGDGG
jgi:hypothetical protein